MQATIQRIFGTFTTVGVPVALTIPVASRTVALRFYESEISPVIGIIVVTVPDPSGAPSSNATYRRLFQLVADGDPLPSTFKKYVATFPFGPNKNIVHIVEV